MCRTMMTLLPVVGLVGSNNLSTAVIILGIGVMLIFVANPRYLQFLALGSAGVGFIAVFLLCGKLPPGASGDLEGSGKI